MEFKEAFESARVLEEVLACGHTAKVARALYRHIAEKSAVFAAEGEPGAIYQVQDLDSTWRDLPYEEWLRYGLIYRRVVYTNPPTSVRNSALQEAAKVCDSVNNHDNPMTARDCADAIRALKT